jgi:hypothetical protein
MAVSRYVPNNSFVPQPIRKVVPSYTDVLHPLKMGERIDNLAYKYYKDPLLSWVIMCANPQYDNEFEIPYGVTIRIPYPLQRVFDAWLINDEV